MQVTLQINANCIGCEKSFSRPTDESLKEPNRSLFAPMSEILRCHERALSLNDPKIFRVSRLGTKVIPLHHVS